MPKIGMRWLLGSAVVVALSASMLLGSCSNESLGGTGSGGKTGGGSATGAGGSLEGDGGATGTGASNLGFGGGPAPTGGIGGDGVGGDCLVIVDSPPLFSVIDDQTGAPICDPTFDIVGVSPGGVIPDASGNPASCDDMGVYGCPSPPTTPCQVALEAIGAMSATSNYTVQVSAPGYGPSLAYDVVAGQEGCSVNSPASQITIHLSPIPGSVPVDAGLPSDASVPSDAR